MSVNTKKSAHNKKRWISIGMLPHTGSKSDSVHKANDSGSRSWDLHSDRKLFIAASALTPVSATVREGGIEIDGIVEGGGGVEEVQVCLKKLLNV